MSKQIKIEKQKQMTEEQRALAMENKRLAMHMANKYRYSGVPVEDLEQEALLATCSAALYFDEQRDCLFSTFATKCIVVALSKFVREFLYQSCQPGGANVRKDTMGTIRENSPGDDGTTDMGEAFDMPSDEEDRRQEKMAEAVRFLMDGLSERERQIICGRWGLEGDPMSFAYLEKKTGMTYATLRRCYNAAMSKMRERAKVYNI